MSKTIDDVLMQAFNDCSGGYDPIAFKPGAWKDNMESLDRYSTILVQAAAYVMLSPVRIFPAIAGICRSVMPSELEKAHRLRIVALSTYEVHGRSKLLKSAFESIKAGSHLPYKAIYAMDVRPATDKNGRKTGEMEAELKEISSALEPLLARIKY